jgi:hypothetical protein
MSKNQIFGARAKRKGRAVSGTLPTRKLKLNRLAFRRKRGIGAAGHNYGFVGHLRGETPRKEFKIPEHLVGAASPGGTV